MKKITAVLLCLCAVFSLAACSGGKNESKSIKIISSVFPSYDFAKQICRGVDGVEIKMLITPGTEPHSYEPSVRDMAEIKESDLFIYLGGESDEWVDSLLDTFEDGEVNTLKMTDCVPLLTEEVSEGMQSDGEEIGAKENDEHVWTLPANAILICGKIKDELCAIDSENAKKYTENCENYTADLLLLDSEFKKVFSDDAVLIVADRFPFRYLADGYKFSYYAAFPGCSTESDPSAATMAFLENKVRETGAKAVFYTEFSSQKVASTLSEATGVKTLMLHSCHNVSKSDFESGATYISLMTQNIKNLQEALN